MQAMEKPHGSIWLARLCLLLGAGSVVMALVGAIGAGQDWWGKLEGLSVVMAAVVVALVEAKKMIQLVHFQVYQLL